MTPVELKRLISIIDGELQFRKLEEYQPTEKQLEFHGNGTWARERGLGGGNRTGKTTAVAAELAMHMTGIYPEWWKGRRYDRPTVWWYGCVRYTDARDGYQRLLLGQPGAEYGTGFIPKDAIYGRPKLMPGIPNTVETFMVKHVSGGISSASVKSYDHREAWMVTDLDGVAFDEEPPFDIYSEGRTRTLTREGMTMLSYTPLKGRTKVWSRLAIEKPELSSFVMIDLDDATFYSAEQRRYMASTYPEHERKARVHGIPSLGSGAVFPVDEDEITERVIDIPPHWPRGVGMDIGYDHATAFVWGALDTDTDTLHIYDVYKLREKTPVFHAEALKRRGSWIPVFWPHDAAKHDFGVEGKQIAQIYADLGVNMHRHKGKLAHSTHAPGEGQKEGEGGIGTAAGVMNMLDRMLTGLFKIASHLEDWWNEFRTYYRKDGAIVKENDDVMSASRQLTMMTRHFKVKPIAMRMKPRTAEVYTPSDPTMGPMG